MFFVVCNVPRIVLNFEELSIVAPSYWQRYNFFGVNGTEANNTERVNATETNNNEQNENFCYSPPFWAHVLRSISRFLLTLNASVCCFVYCIICRVFRSELQNRIQTIIAFVLKTFRSSQN